MKRSSTAESPGGTARFGSPAEETWSELKPVSARWSHDTVAYEAYGAVCDDQARNGKVSKASSMVSRSTADRKSTRLNSSHMSISYAVFCLKKKKHEE